MNREFINGFKIMSILLTGGSGLLGTQLTSLDSSIISPERRELDIENRSDCRQWVETLSSQDILIHAAAFTSLPGSEEDPGAARNANIVGTVNLVNACQSSGVRLVYISTDYVFSGDKGFYKEEDPINPINLYAKTKAAGELAVRTYDNSLVIRTSFCENEFPHEKAFTDQFTSRDYVDVIAPMILAEAKSNRVGIAHVGTERKSVYELARQRKLNVGELSILAVSFNAPRDTSFYN